MCMLNIRVRASASGRAIYIRFSNLWEEEEEEREEEEGGGGVDIDLHTSYIYNINHKNYKKHTYLRRIAGSNDHGVFVAPSTNIPS